MGRMKEWMMKQQAEGWHSVGQKYVCAKCFDDNAIQQFIRDNLVEKLCSYCERRGRVPVAAHMDAVLEFIADGINSEYEDPANSVHFESAEGGYTLATMDGQDLMEAVDLGESHEDVFRDLCQAFSDQPWIHKDPYGDLECDALRYNWDDFATMVKHHTRFVFFRLTTAGKMAWEPEPQQILDSLHQIVTEVDLVKIIPAKTNFFRAHQHEPSEKLTKAKRLGTPPPEFASHSRMSPAGIPMLYVANDAATAVAEVTHVHATRTHFTTAQFQNVRPLRVLDLSTIPPVPSLFDEHRRHQRMPLVFLRHFAGEISRPITDAAKSYEYVPTQVMTEYFRHLFHLPTRSNPDPAPRLDGIAFRSSKHGKGVNFTLFIDQDGCRDDVASAGVVMALRRFSTHP